METNEMPKSLLEAIAYFANEGHAHDFLVQMRWPNGVRCAHCQSESIGKLSVSTTTNKAGKEVTRRVWNCKACKRQFTAKVGTIFEDSPISLSKWLPAVWLVVNAKNGISSHELARSLNITQKSAWHMGHRIRTAIQRGGGVVRMDGVVECDESFIGGKARNMHKDKRDKLVFHHGAISGKVAKAAVMGVLQRSSEKNPVSKVVANAVPSIRRGVLERTIKQYVVEGAEIHTDMCASYNKLSATYVHKVVDHAECYVKDGVHTNGLENFWSLLKRTLKGTHVHVAPFHLFRYLDDQTYRFNERKENDQTRFVNAVRTVKGRRLTYEKLTGKPKKIKPDASAKERGLESGSWPC